MTPSRIKPLASFSIASHTTKNAVPEIYLYDDIGTSSEYLRPFLATHFPGHTLVCVNRDDVRNPEEMAKRQGMFVLPGISGEICPYYDQIREEGRHNLHDFTTRPGNILLTICAGTYVLWPDITYHASSGNIISRRSNLALLDGTVSGPPESLRINPARDGFALARVEYTDSTGEVDYATLVHENGPAMNEADILRQNGKILGHYTSEKERTVSACSLPYENGRIIALATLPYIGARTLQDVKGPYSAKLHNMSVHEPGRQRYCNLILQEIAEHNPLLKPKFYTKRTMALEAPLSQAAL